MIFQTILIDKDGKTVENRIEDKLRANNKIIPVEVNDSEDFLYGAEILAGEYIDYKVIVRCADNRRELDNGNFTGCTFEIE